MQYFENALLEFHPTSKEALRGLPEAEQVVLVIQPAGLGAALAAGRSLPAAQPPHSTSPARIRPKAELYSWSIQSP